MEEHVAEHQCAIGRTPKGDMATRVARCRDDGEARHLIPFPEGPGHRLSWTSQWLAHPRQQAARFWQQSEKRSRLNRITIPFPTPQGNIQSRADGMGTALVIEMAVRQGNRAYGMRLECLQHLLGCKSRAGVDQHVADKIDVDDVERWERKLPNARANLFESPSRKPPPIFIKCPQQVIR
jgi:hypothetical protein